jgi:hypothetical protein
MLSDLFIALLQVDPSWFVSWHRSLSLLMEFPESVIDVILHAELRDRMILLRGLLVAYSPP